MSQPPSIPVSAKSDVCPQCGSDADWTASSWCATCGYYPAIGRLVETPTLQSEEQVYENWWEAVPQWLWILVGGVIALFVTSVGVRVAFAESAVRMWWTVAQLAIGATGFFAAHLLAYMHGASRSDRVGPLDAILKPIATWQPVLRSLPEKCKLLWTGGWSLTAVLLAFFVIDGIDYQALTESRKEDEEAKKRANPMAFVIKSAQTVATAQNGLPSAGGNAESLEDALSDFTGADGTEDGYAELLKESGVADSLSGGLPGELSDSMGDLAGVDSQGDSPGVDAADGSRLKDGPEADGGGEPAGTHNPLNSPGDATLIPDKENLRDSIQCVVIGYTTNSSGEPRSLLLAALIRDRLRFVAKVPLDRVTRDALIGMPERLSQLHQARPVTASPFGGRWLRPELFCDVRHAGWTANGRLSEPFITQIAIVTPTSAEDVDSSVKSR